MRNDCSINFHQSKLSIAKFSILYDISLLRDWKRKLKLITLGSERVNFYKLFFFKSWQKPKDRGCKNMYKVFCHYSNRPQCLKILIILFVSFVDPNCYKYNQRANGESEGQTSQTRVIEFIKAINQRVSILLFWWPYFNIGGCLRWWCLKW